MTKQPEPVRDWIVRDFEAAQNATFRQRVRLGEDGDESWDFTGATFKMEVRGKSGGAVVLQLTDGNGKIISINSETRLLELVVTAGEMATRPAGPFLYDLLVTQGADTKVRMRGRFAIVPNITVI